MALARATLVRPGGISVTLPWWPESINHTPSGVEFAEVGRPGRTPLLIPESRTLAERTIDALIRQVDLSEPVEDHLKALAAIRKSPDPVTLMLGMVNRGLWHMTALSIAEVLHTRTGAVSVADVSMTLKRASPATVNVGPVERR